MWCLFLLQVEELKDVNLCYADELPHDLKMQCGDNEMMKTLGFGLGALTGPILMTAAILYTAAPEAEVPVEEQTMIPASDVVANGKVYKDYGVVWSKL